jgi:hypothetical protein
MTPTAETWLQLLVLGLYLQDSVQWLRCDEALLERSWRGRWAARFGAMSWKLGGREPCLPNPFTPHRASFRLRWRMEDDAASKGRAVVCAPAAVLRFGVFAWLSGVSLFVLLPMGLFTNAGPRLAIAAAVLVYASNFVALGLAYRWRDRLGIQRKRLAALAVECLACAPYSVNLVRRLCAAMTVDEDFTVAAGRLLEPEAFAQARQQCLARVDEQLDAEPEGSRRFVLLERARVRFL